MYIMYIIYVHSLSTEDFKLKRLIERFDVHFWLSLFMRFMYFVDAAQN